MTYLIDDEVSDYINDLISSNSLEGAALGIAKQFLDKGYSSLSAKQLKILEAILPSESQRNCTACCAPIPWCEMLESRDNGGYCSWCSHQLEKQEND